MLIVITYLFTFCVYGHLSVTLEIGKNKREKSIMKKTVLLQGLIINMDLHYPISSNPKTQTNRLSCYCEFVLIIFYYHSLISPNTRLLAIIPAVPYLSYLLLDKSDRLILSVTPAGSNLPFS